MRMRIQFISVFFVFTRRLSRSFEIADGFRHINFIFCSLLLTLFFTTQIHSQKVGLVLSGGGVRGMAHIGVIKALEENNIPIDYITGTSAGALVGSMYASGKSPAPSAWLAGTAQ